MTDIDKTIKEAEEKYGIKLSEKDKSAIEAFGTLMDILFPKTQEPQPQKEECKILKVDEVVSGLNYCLNQKNCINCAYRKDKMFATCKPLAENSLRLLRKQIPVKPIIKHLTSYPNQKPINQIVCGSCQQWKLEAEALYCGNCGQKVDWK